MAVRLDAPAPYGPPAGVLALINAFRDRGLPSPLTPEVLARAGISESLVPRVYKSLEALDLIAADGTPLPALVALRQAKTDEFKGVLADAVRSAYAEILQFVNPASDDLTRITDAFRPYQPAGQRTRMVTLFVGLCEAAGLRPVEEKKESANGPSRPSPRPAQKMVRIQRAARSASSGGPASRPPVATTNDIPPALIALLQSIPRNGWTQDARNKFVTAFGHFLDFVVPVVEAPADEVIEVEDGDVDMQ